MIKILQKIPAFRNPPLRATKMLNGSSQFAHTHDLDQFHSPREQPTPPDGQAVLTSFQPLAEIHHLYSCKYRPLKGEL